LLPQIMRKRAQENDIIDSGKLSTVACHANFISHRISHISRYEKLRRIYTYNKLTTQVKVI
jgi:hypothetical protein